MIPLSQMEILERTAREHAAAPWRKRGEVIDRAAQALGCSRQTVFRKLEEADYDLGAGRKPRADSGTTSISPEALDTIAAMLLSGTRANGKRILTIKAALEIARANGVIGNISETTLSRQLEARGLHPKQLAQPTPHTNLQSLHPNHVWQIDASVCVLFYLETGQLTVMEEQEFNKNKPKNLARIEKQRCIRYLITDHYSGAFYLEYVLGAESQENLANVFINAITRREGEPFCGVPFHLMMDKGSANVSHQFKNLLKHLQVKHLVHATGNARAKGQVENTHNIVERGFEGRFRMDPTIQVASLEELNRLARDWRIAVNSTARHTRHGKTRYALWMTILPEQLRLAQEPTLLREAMTGKEREATVRGDLTLRFSAGRAYGSRLYDVRHIPGVMVGGKLPLRVNPYRAPAIDVVVRDETGEERLVTVEPMTVNEAGFLETAAIIGETYKAKPDTLADQARKRLTEMAYGAAEAEEGAKPQAFAGRIDPWADVRQAPEIAWLPRAGSHLETTAPAREAAPLTTTRAAMMLRDRLGRTLTPEEFSTLSSQYPTGVPESALAELHLAFSGRAIPGAPRLALVVGG